MLRFNCTFKYVAKLLTFFWTKHQSPSFFPISAEQSHNHACTHCLSYTLSFIARLLSVLPWWVYAQQAVTFFAYRTIPYLHLEQPHLVGKRLLSNNPVLIRDGSFGERHHHMHSHHLPPRIGVLSRGLSSLMCPLRGPLYPKAKIPLRKGNIEMYHLCDIQDENRIFNNMKKV